MPRLKFWKWILSQLDQGNDIALLTVVDHSKGSPGKRGFKLALNALGECQGTIGGGIMEVNLSRMALRALREKENIPRIIPQYHHKKAAQWQSGMICAGHQEIVLCLLQKVSIPILEEIIRNLERNLSVNIGLSRVGLHLLPISSQEQIESCGRNTMWYASKDNAEGDFLYQETIRYENTLCIVGGGHVGAALARVGWDLGFYVHVIDFRPNLPTLLDQSCIHQVSLIPFTDIRQVLPPTLKHAYAVIVSTSAVSDEVALRQLVTLPFAYLGLMGSPAKIEHIFSKLLADGFAQDDLNKVHAPVGIEIQSESAEEIAISIAAQLIWIKNSRKENKNVAPSAVIGSLHDSHSTASGLLS